MIDEAIIEAFLAPYPFQDDTVRSYVIQLLQEEDSWPEVPTGSDNVAFDPLVEMVSPFWDGKESTETIRSVLIRLHEALGLSQTSACTTAAAPTKQSSVPNAAPASENSIASTIAAPATTAATITTDASRIERKIETTKEPSYSTGMPLSTGVHENGDQSAAVSAAISTTTTIAMNGTHPTTKRAKKASSRQRTKGVVDKKGVHSNSTRGVGQDCRGDDDDSTEQSPPILVEDEASAWNECLQQGVAWGGRGKGGRGEYSGAVNSIKSNIHLSKFSVSLDDGTDLLMDATFDIVRGHRYGLIGRNGVGKSTLLKRLSHKAIPGMPLDMRITLVQQQVQGSKEWSALNTLLRADVDRIQLLQEQEFLESRLEDIAQAEDVVTAADRLGEIAAELDAIEADTAEQRAMAILEGLQFTTDMIHGPTENLSGGWRMRLALAQALFVHCDLLLFDECTNHLDLHGLDWLIQYLNTEKKTDRTVIIVSHDKNFLNSVCTDIIVMEHQQLKCHPGNYAEYERQQQEKAARESQILDAAERQRAKAQAFIQKQESKSADPNKQRQAKMIKDKKLERIGNYREDGKRYKLRSLKKLSEDHLRLAEKVEIQVDDPVVKMKFPNPSWPPGIGSDDPIIRFDNLSFGYQPDRMLFENVTLSVHRGSKAALVGKNGSGKSTLLRLVANEEKEHMQKGELWIHPSIRIGHVSQYSVEELEAFSSMTTLEYADNYLKDKPAALRSTGKGSGNIRQYLGAFGLGGKHALRKLGKLSGGERMRLCFATILADEPHVLLLDESTNHVDMETLDSMSEALNEFEGAILMVSHNQSFLSGFCKELWVLDNQRITVTHSDTETFDEIFSDYRSSVAQGSSQLRSQRQGKADRAKQAAQQRSGAKQLTALL